MGMDPPAKRQRAGAVCKLILEVDENAYILP